MAVDRYALVDSGGNTVNIIVADPIVYAPPAGFTLALVINAAATAPPAPSTVMPVDRFLDRFTAAEFAALVTLCATDATAHAGLIRWLSGVLVDLTSPKLKTALDYLVSKSVITAARETVMLTP